jgi:hypothetical protein
MNVTINKKAIVAAIKQAKKAVDVKSKIPILSTVLLAASDESITMQTTDLEIYIRIRLDCEVYENGSACIPIADLSKVVNKDKSKNINILCEDRTWCFVNGVRMECVTDEFPQGVWGEEQSGTATVRQEPVVSPATEPEPEELVQEPITFEPVPELEEPVQETVCESNSNFVAENKEFRREKKIHGRALPAQ